MYNEKVSAVLHYMGVDLSEVSLAEIDGIITVMEWNSAIPQPTEQEYMNVATSQAFLDWEAEHGGDALLTLRRLAKESLSDAKAESALLRAALLVVVDEFNSHSDKMNSLLDAIDGAASLAALKTTVAGIADLPQRTGAQLRTAAENKLTAGDADT